MHKNVKLVLHWHMDIIRQWYLYWTVRLWEKWLIKRAEKYAEAAYKRVAENFLIKHMVEIMEKVYKELEVCRVR